MEQIHLIGHRCTDPTIFRVILLSFLGTKAWVEGVCVWGGEEGRGHYKVKRGGGEVLLHCIFCETDMRALPIIMSSLTGLTFMQCLARRPGSTYHNHS